MAKFLLKATTLVALMLAVNSLPTYADTILFNIESGRDAIYTVDAGSFSIADLGSSSGAIDNPASKFLALTFTTIDAGGPSVTTTNCATSFFATADGFAWNVAGGTALYASVADFSLTGAQAVGPTGSLFLSETDHTPVTFNSAFLANIDPSLNLPAD